MNEPSPAKTLLEWNHEAVKGYSFDGEKRDAMPRLTPEEAALAHMLEQERLADAALKKAIEGLPDYTGQWSSQDLFRDEAAAYRLTVKKLAEAIRLVAKQGA